MRFIFLICLFSISVFSCTSQKSKSPNYIKAANDSIKIDIETKRNYISHKIVSIDSVLIKLPSFNIDSKPLFSIHDSLLLLATSKSDKAYCINLSSNDIVKEYKIRNVIVGFVDVTKPSSKCAIDIESDLQSLDFYLDDYIILQTENRLSIVSPSGDLIDSIVFTGNKLVYSNVYDVPIEYSPYQ